MFRPKTRDDLTERQLRELTRIVYNPGTVKADKLWPYRVEAEWLVSRGLAKWGVSGGMATDTLFPTPKGIAVQDAF